MKPVLKLSLFAAAFLASSALLAWQRDRAAIFRRSLADVKQATAQLTRENARLQQIVATHDATETAQHVREEIARTRQQIASWEQRVQQPPAPTRRALHFTDNRDPEKGPVRLEHFRHQGQATPSAAFQTAVWAAATGGDEAWADLLAISAAGREKLQTLLSSMSPELRARYTPPEKLLGLLFARDLLDEEGFEIGATTAPNASGLVHLRVLRAKEGRRNKLEKKYPFVPGQSGWQIPISDAMIERLPDTLAQASMYVPPQAPRR